MVIGDSNPNLDGYRLPRYLVNEARYPVQKQLRLLHAVLSSELQETRSCSISIARLTPCRFVYQQSPVLEGLLYLPCSEAANSNFPERDIVQTSILCLNGHRMFVAFDS